MLKGFRYLYTMKTLILVRHAKSDWGSPTLGDFDRPLNERGKRDAPAMAARLRDKHIRIDRFVSSPAKRARKTAVFFAKEFQSDKDDIQFMEELYAAPAHVFFDVIAKQDDKDATIAVFSHNPGITEFANLLTAARIDNIPTCGVFAVKVHADKWADFESATKEFWFFDYPKSVLE